MEERLAVGAAALQHLEMSLVNTACDDPGAAIGSQLALPMLQERLDELALEFAKKRAAEAEEAIVRMDVRRLSPRYALSFLLPACKLLLFVSGCSGAQRSGRVAAICTATMLQ